MKRWKHIWKTGVAMMCAAAVLSGCSVKETLSSNKNSAKEYGKAETMVILSTERLRYEDLYTEEIWSAAVDNRGTAFESVLLTQVHDFLKELKLMSNMAGENGIALTSREKELVKAAASRYYEELGDTNADAFGLSKGEIEDFYDDYWTAEKMVDQLTGDINLEVSDSEAKVITVSQIVVSDRETADAALLKVQEENADFNSVAKEYSESEEVKLQIHYGMMGTSYEKAAYALESGQISDVIAEDGKYYILKCVSDYDVDATKIRKEEMMRQKKQDAFYTSYQAYKAEHPLTEDKELWETLSVTECPLVEADFFEIYEEVCLEMGDEA